MATKKRTAKKAKATKKSKAKTAPKRRAPRKKAAKPIGPKRPPGRPKEPVPADVVEELLEYLYANAKHSIDSFSKLEHTPARRTLYQWMAKDKEFRAQILRAHEDRGDMLASLALHIATTQDIGERTEVAETKDGTFKKVTSEDMLGHRKLQVDTCLRLAAVLNKRYSAKHQVEHSGAVTLEQLIQESRKDDDE